MDWSSLCKDVGVATTLVVAGIIILLLLIKWVLEQFKVELTENRKERVAYLDRLGEIKREMEQHGQRSRDFQEHVIREHKEMIDVLGRINGHHK